MADLMLFFGMLQYSNSKKRAMNAHAAITAHSVTYFAAPQHFAPYPRPHSSHQRPLGVHEVPCGTIQVPRAPARPHHGRAGSRAPSAAPKAALDTGLRRYDGVERGGYREAALAGGASREPEGQGTGKPLTLRNHVTVDAKKRGFPRFA